MTEGNLFERRFSTAVARHLRLVSVGVASALLLAGCFSSTPEQKIEKARQAYQQHNYHAAEVQLKSVLRDHGDNGKAWALLGHVSMADREYEDAIYQFRKAQENGQPAAALAVPLGHALIRRGQYEKALKVLQVNDSSATKHARAELASLRGQAYAGQDKADKADSAYAEALRIEPGLATALQGRARLAMGRGDLEDARKELAKAVSAHPDEINSLTLLGQVDYQLQRCDSAVTHLSHALKIGSNQMTNGQRQGSQTLLADCQLRAGKADAAQKNISAILSANPNNPLGNYLQALVYIRQGQYQQAANHVQATLNVSPKSLRAMTLMAWLRIAQGRPEDAQPFLSRVLKLAPNDVAAIRLQAGLWAAQNEEAKAQDLLQNASQNNPDQPGLRKALSAVAAELKQQQAQGQASGLNNVSLQLDLARSLAQAGSKAAAATVLSKIEPTTDSERRAVETARIRIALATGNTQKALEQAEDLAKRNPDDADIQILLARAYAAAGRGQKAAEVLAQTRKSHPENTSVAYAQARLAARKGDYATAIDDLAPLHRANPDDTGLVLTLAGLYTRAGKADQAVHVLKSSIDRQPESDALKQALARAYLADDKVDPALAVIDGELKANKEVAQWLRLKGVAQLMKGQTDEALQTLNEAADKAPDQPKLALNIARVELGLGRSEAAIKHLQALRKKSPDYLPAAGLLALAQANAGNTDAALKQVSDLRQAGREYDADVLDGTVLRAAKRFRKADASYAKAYQQQPSARLAMMRYQTRRAGKIDDPAKPLRQWLDKSPNDATVAMQLASWYQQQGQTERASTLYQKVLQTHPDTVVALNNLAMIHAQSDPKQALAYARKAHHKAPDSAAVTDTLGWILVGQNQLDTGIPLLEKADKAAGDHSPLIRFHLGAALAERDDSEDRRRAKTLLQKAISAGLPDQQDGRAKALLKRM